MIKKQFTLYLENRPGELARVTKLLAAEKINIDGISLSASTDVGLVQLVASNSTTASKVLKKAGIPFTVQDIALLSLKNEHGALAKVVSKLTHAGLNINYVYATGCDCKAGCDCHVVISAPNLKKVERVWQAK
jgi:hypothetical protein